MGDCVFVYVVCSGMANDSDGDTISSSSDDDVLFVSSTTTETNINNITNNDILNLKRRVSEFNNRFTFRAQQNSLRIVNAVSGTGEPNEPDSNTDFDAPSTSNGVRARPSNNRAMNDDRVNGLNYEGGNVVMRAAVDAINSVIAREPKNEATESGSNDDSNLLVPMREEDFVPLDDPLESDSDATVSDLDNLSFTCMNSSKRRGGRSLNKLSRRLGRANGSRRDETSNRTKLWIDNNCNARKPSDDEVIADVADAEKQKDTRVEVTDVNKEKNRDDSQNPTQSSQASSVFQHKKKLAGRRLLSSSSSNGDSGE